MTDNTTFISTVKTTHTNAEFTGVTPNTSATVSPPGNATTWSRASARAALASGAITQNQFIAVMNYLANYEQEQISQARDTSSLRGTYLAVS